MPLALALAVASRLMIAAALWLALSGYGVSQILATWNIKSYYSGRNDCV
jgi:hypothetical protein